MTVDPDWVADDPRLMQVLVSRFWSGRLSLRWLAANGAELPLRAQGGADASTCC